MGWAPLADDGKPGGGKDDHAMRQPPLPTSAVSNGVLKVSRHERYVDDLTGQPLPPELCRAARATELDYFLEKEVWTIRKVSEALRRTGKPPITVRWVEVNKGDDLCPKIRSRLVAREIRLKGEEAIFAPTPPLESLRMVLSHAATQFPNEPKKIWEGESPDRQMISGRSGQVVAAGCLAPKAREV